MKFLWRFSEKQSKIKYLYPIASIFFILSVLLSLLLGSVKLNISDMFGEIGRQIILYARLPRILACIIAGGALAVSGSITQNLFSNRLASPSILGVNSGAGLAITVCTALGYYSGIFTAAASFLGAFLSVLLIAIGAHKWGRSRGTVILMGVAMNSLLNAVSSAIITLDPDVGVLSNDFKVGDFSSVAYGQIIPAAILTIIAFCIALTFSNELDILGLGEDTALGLGLNTKSMRLILMIIAAALAGAAVSLAGLLSFVGLIVPNAIRYLSGSRSKHLIPLSMLFGSSFTLVCDTFARTFFAPYEIPVGIVMAFIGAPFFAFILINKKGGATHD